MTRPTIRVFLDITDFECAPEAVSQSLGVKPTRTWKAGDLVGSTGPTWPTNGWRLERLGGGAPDLEQRVLELLNDLPDDLGALSQVTSSWEGQLSFVVELADEAPGMYFSVETLRRVERLGISLDIDLYLYGQRPVG